MQLVFVLMAILAVFCEVEAECLGILRVSSVKIQLIFIVNHKCGTFMIGNKNYLCLD